MTSPVRSAGLLMYRRTARGIEVLLAHPGGPYYVKKDLGSWTVPKGEPAGGEDAKAAACREFTEETGFPCTGELLPLGEVRQKSGKVVEGEITKEGDGFVFIDVMIGKMSPQDAINEVVSGTDDFFLIWDRTTHDPREFVYSSSRRPGAWLTPFIDLTFSVVPEPPPPAAVPINPLTLMLIAGVIGLVGCRELAARRGGGKLVRRTGLKRGLRSS